MPWQHLQQALLCQSLAEHKGIAECPMNMSIKHLPAASSINVEANKADV